MLCLLHFTSLNFIHPEVRCEAVREMSHSKCCYSAVHVVLNGARCFPLSTTQHLAALTCIDSKGEMGTQKILDLVSCPVLWCCQLWGSNWGSPGFLPTSHAKANARQMRLWSLCALRHFTHVYLHVQTVRPQ